jgi:hypothetical protein
MPLIPWKEPDEVLILSSIKPYFVIGSNAAGLAAMICPIPDLSEGCLEKS